MRISAPETNVGSRFNKDKSFRPELMSPWALEGVSAVLAFGAKKYAADNWAKGLSWRETMGSLLRHVLALLRGEDTDPESKLPHVDHMLCNALFLSHFMKLKQYKKFDDRWRPEPDEDPEDE